MDSWAFHALGQFLLALAPGAALRLQHSPLETLFLLTGLGVWKAKWGRATERSAWVPADGVRWLAGWSRPGRLTQCPRRGAAPRCGLLPMPGVGPSERVCSVSVHANGPRGEKQQQNPDAYGAFAAELTALKQAPFVR